MWHVFVNSRFHQSNRWPAIASRLSAHHSELTIHATSTQQEIEQLVHQAVEQEHSHFAAIGGDGAVNLLLNAVMNHEWITPPTLGIIPAGTGCDFARSLDIPQDAAAAIAQMFLPRSRLVDVGAVHQKGRRRYFLNIANIGLGAVAVRRAEQLRWLGPLRYLAAFWLSLPGVARKSVTITTDTESQTFSAFEIIVANGCFFGKGFEIAPTAVCDNGQLDCYVFVGSPASIPWLFLDVVRRRHLQRRDVVRLNRSSSIKITGDSFEAEVDGEPIGRGHMELSIRHAQLKIAGSIPKQP